MKWSITLAIAVVVGIQPSIGGGKPVAAPVAGVLQLNVRIFEGDPLGSREAGTMKEVAWPTVVAMENKEFTLRSGGEIKVKDGDSVELGWKVKCKASAVDGGKVLLDISLSKTTVGSRTDEGMLVHTECTRKISTLKLAEVIKLRCGQGSADKQAWAEISVEAAKR